MDLTERLRAHTAVVPGQNPGRYHLIHPLNGRAQAVDTEGLDTLLGTMVRDIDLSVVDVILGLPEGGSVPAYAFARAARRPLLLATRVILKRPAITFDEPHSHANTTRALFVYGLAPGQRVMIVEDELTNGRTAVNAVRALRAAGVVIDQIAALMVIDHPPLWQRMAAERVTLHAGVRLSPEYAPRPLDSGA